METESRLIALNETEGGKRVISGRTVIKAIPGIRPGLDKSSDLNHESPDNTYAGGIIRHLRRLTPQGGRSLTLFAARCLGKLRLPRLEPLIV